MYKEEMKYASSNMWSNSNSNNFNMHRFQSINTNVNIIFWSFLHDNRFGQLLFDVDTNKKVYIFLLFFFFAWKIHTNFDFMFANVEIYWYWAQTNLISASNYSTHVLDHWKQFYFMRIWSVKLTTNMAPVKQKNLRLHWYAKASLPSIDTHLLVSYIMYRWYQSN